MRNTFCRNGIAIALAVLPGLAACGPDQPPPVEHAAEAILNGTNLERPLQLSLGLATVMQGTCSATLYKNDWALTARHCANLANSGFNEVYYPAYDTSSIRGGSDQVLFMPNQDLALIHLVQPFVINGSDSGYKRRMATGLPSVGSTLLCAGHGENQVKLTGGFAGELGWRWARLKVTSTNASTASYVVKRNTDGQIIAPGDSGGPCFVDPASTPLDPQMVLTGIHSTVIPVCITTTCNKENAMGVSEANDVSMGKLASTIALWTKPGVQVEAATYGGGGCGSISVTSTVRSACEGRTTCPYFVDHHVLGDPDPGCAKPFTVSYRCAGGALRSLTIPNASGKTANLDCSKISILRATYGMNLVQTGELGLDKIGNATADMEASCANRSSCSYRITVDRLGDPAWGKSKDFVVEHTCDGRFGVAVTKVADSAEGQSVTLSCP
jgi:hypothetical protein